jgi:hypothetical protein
MLWVALLLVSVCWAAGEKTCDGNRFMYQSTYLLGLQEDLAKTISEINGTAKMDEIFFRDELFRTYRIHNLAQNIVYQQANQNAFIQTTNVLRVTGGNIKVNITFDWEKTQLGSSLNGTGMASVSTDIITFEKTLHTNDSHEMQWYMSRADPIEITNGISLNNMEPYKAADYEILSNMLNKLKNNQTTVKDNLYKVINANYKNILAKYVLEDEVYPLLYRRFISIKLFNTPTLTIMESSTLPTPTHSWTPNLWKKDYISSLVRSPKEMTVFNVEISCLSCRKTPKLSEEPRSSSATV